ncbi:uncharacterized protein LOC129587345 [Paramacrobiotus metropolitanus]|uniref:uncharacterized protein LOC129587345 n=1 Tax=Paramacrobiotus metropolitanus TaxID=2943436 RepID=UPI0024463F88|nr:uncharacterized protein LOC129587345 [Paramacrobiotus metropolitanus]XP_055337028.1 uncharacterized protein LOC129587345 [Paramacrobiotus metropolitanus]
MLWRVGSLSGGPWLVRWRSVGRSPFAVAHAQPSAWESAVQLQSARTLAVSALYPTFLRGNDFLSSSARCLSTWTSGDPRSASFRSSENGHGSSLMISPWGRWLHQPAAGFLGHSSVYALHNAVLHHQRRFLHVSPRRWEAAEEKSKVERTVEALKKDKQSKERVLQPPAVPGGSGGDSAVAAAGTEEKALAAPPKKTAVQTPSPVLAEVLLKTAQLKDVKPADVTKTDLQSVAPLVQEITKQDMEHIEDVIEKISKEKYSLLEQQDLKEEVQEYKEDIQELKQLPEASKLQESKAARRLTKRVDKMLTSMEKLMQDLETQKSDLKTEIKDDKAQLQQLQKAEDADRQRMLDMVDAMDQKKDYQLSIDEPTSTVRRQPGKLPVIFSRSAATLAANSRWESVSDAAIEDIKHCLAELAKCPSIELDSGDYLHRVLDGMTVAKPELHKHLDVAAVDGLLRDRRPLRLPPAVHRHLLVTSVSFLHKKRSRYSILKCTLSAPNDLSREARAIVAAAKDREKLEMSKVGKLMLNLLYTELRAFASPAVISGLIDEVAAERRAVARAAALDAFGGVMRGDESASYLDASLMLVKKAAGLLSIAPNEFNHIDSRLIEDMRNALYLVRSGAVGREAQLVLGHYKEYDWRDYDDEKFAGESGRVTVHNGWVYFMARITIVHTISVGGLTARILRALGNDAVEGYQFSGEIVDRHGCGTVKTKNADSGILLSALHDPPEVFAQEAVVIESSFSNENTAVLFIEAANWLGKTTRIQYCVAVKVGYSKVYFNGCVWVFRKVAAPIGKTGPGKIECDLVSTPTGEKDGVYNVYMVNNHRVTALKCEKMTKAEILTIFDMDLVFRCELNKAAVYDAVKFDLPIVMRNGDRKLYTVDLSGYCKEVYSAWLQHNSTVS